MSNSFGTKIISTPDPRLSAVDRAQVRVLERQEKVTPFPYYSKVRFHAVAPEDDPGPFTYTVAQGTQVRAFSYRIGGLGTSGGFAGITMTAADTNLVSENQTINGEAVKIDGIAIQVNHGTYDNMFTDTRFLVQLAGNVSVDLSLNGDQNRHHLGNLNMIPGAGGLLGPGIDQLGTQPIDGGRFPYDVSGNGWQTRSNFFRLPDGLIWMPSGYTDGMLNIIFTAERDIVLYSGGDAYNPQADEAAAAGVRGYKYPNAIKCELMVFLIGTVVGQRTRVA